MLSILMTAALSSALGQQPYAPVIPADNPMQNALNLLYPQAPVTMRGLNYAPGAAAGAYGYGGGYPSGYAYGPGYGYPGSMATYGGGVPTSTGVNFGSNSVGNCLLAVQGQMPGYGGGGCGHGGGSGYIGCGTTIGPYPQQMCQQPMYMQQGQMGGSNLLPLAQAATQEREKEWRELDRRLEGLKLILDRMSDSLKIMDQRVQNAEKAALSVDAKVEWLKEQWKERWYWHDFDARIKPIEESLRQLQKGVQNVGKAEGKIAGQEEGALRDLGQKLDKEFKTLRDLRIQLEQRLKSLEKGDMAPPPGQKDEKKEDLKKDKQIEDEPRDPEPRDAEPKDKSGSMVRPRFPSAVKTTRVSQSKPGAPLDRAMVIVTLPSDAVLFLNGQPTRSQGVLRTFVTPNLENGGSFTYTLRMEVVRNGEVIAQTREVTFQAGSQIRVNFDGPRSFVQTVQVR